MEMLQELTSGRNNPRELAHVSQRRLRAKIPELEKALSGTLRRHHRMILEQLLADIGLLPLRSPNWMPTSRICSAKSKKSSIDLMTRPESTGVWPKSSFLWHHQSAQGSQSAHKTH